MKLSQYLVNVAVSLDMCLNTIVLFGHPSETISTRVAKHRGTSCVAMTVYQMLNAIQKDHCERSLVKDAERRRHV